MPNDDQPRYDPEILQRVLDRLEVKSDAAAGDEPMLVVREHGRPEPSSPARTGLADALQWPATPPLARGIIGGLLALLLVLAVALGLDTASGAAIPAAAPGAVGPGYTLTFGPAVTERQLRNLLLQNQANIVAGPSAVGSYTITFDHGIDARAGAVRLESSGLVNFIAPARRP